MEHASEGTTHEERGLSTTIIVNGRKKTVHGNHVSYEQIVELAFDNPPAGENVVITVMYRNSADPHKHDGILLPGGKVKIKGGTIFNVTATDKS